MSRALTILSKVETLLNNIILTKDQMAANITSEKIGGNEPAIEKPDITEDQVENITPASESDHFDSHYEINNKYAVKGDQSDGKIIWT